MTEQSGSVAGKSAVGRVSGAVSRLMSVSSVQATGQFLRQQLWAWPIIAAVVFGGAGWWVHHVVEDAMREKRATDLNAMVDASAKAVTVWIGEQRINVQLFAEDEKLRPLVADLLQKADGAAAAERNLTHAEAQKLIRARLERKLKVGGYVGFFVVAPSGIVLAADQDPPVGKVLTGYRKEMFDQGSTGKTLVSKPFRSPLLLADENGNVRADMPSMFAIGPIHDAAGKPIAALGLRIRPEDQFTRILQAVRFGESGETFAFDKNGLLLSQSRFDKDLKQLGLLVDHPDAQSILTVEIRDPQANMVDGARPALRRAEQPLTRAAADAIQGRNGHDADGYRDYRGVPSVGAWRWLAEHDFGIATEVDAAEAFQSLHILRRAYWSLMVLLVLCAIGIFAAMLFISRQQRALQKATLTAKQLGQYALEEKLGAGGMGTVYKARHAMLRRPTAVKLLDVERMTETAIARFEREVQLTSVLTHPNTIAVFDYGRTPEGIFYYAMEFLEGMNLEDFITRFGPMPEARMVFILRQICGSLAEAHAAGMVHRDIKPANILLTRRGGLCDFVKVLDFGLVKGTGADQGNVTNPNVMMGTPLYMAPESVYQVDRVDARADVYAVAAVGYFLLTGTPVFSGATIMEICLKHTNDAPEPPSVRSGRAVSSALEALLLRCLAKAPADRPADAAVLLRDLEACPLSGTWSVTDAAIWWLNPERASLPGDPRLEATRVLDTPVAGATMAYPEQK